MRYKEIDNFEIGYSARRAEVYVYDKSGKQMFSIDNMPAKDIHEGTKDWIKTNYSDVLSDMGLVTRIPLFEIFIHHPEDILKEEGTCVEQIVLASALIGDILPKHVVSVGESSEYTWFFSTHYGEDIYVRTEYLTPEWIDLFTQALATSSDHIEQCGICPHASGSFLQDRVYVDMEMYDFGNYAIHVHGVSEGLVM